MTNGPAKIKDLKPFQYLERPAAKTVK